MSEQFTFFWSGPFSQWFRSSFVVDGVKYNCAEQYMMAEKAIMKSKNPSEQKSWGRKVRNFNVDK